MKDYARLVALGAPDFLEVKGVTYCGNGSGLTMKNVPWHEEVKAFAEALCAAVKVARGGGGGDGPPPAYGMAAEHVHSCCVLLAREDRFLVKGEWHTWIDFERFHGAASRRGEEPKAEPAARPPSPALP